MPIVDRMSGRRVCEEVRRKLPHQQEEQGRGRVATRAAVARPSSARTTSPPPLTDRLKAYQQVNRADLVGSSYHARGKLAEIKFCPSIEETTAEVSKRLWRHNRFRSKMRSWTACARKCLSAAALKYGGEHIEAV